MLRTDTKPTNINVARLAVLIMFFVNGAILGNWVSRIPQIQDTLNLSEGTLGLVLLGLAAGVLVALSMTSGLIARYGSHRITLYGVIALCLLLPPLALMPGALTLWIALFLFGMALSAMDVAMNAQAIDVENRAQRPLMSSFHASFSIGGFAGAGIGAVFATWDVGPLNHFIIVAGLFILISLIAAQNLIPTESAQPDEERDARVFQLPARVLWPLGIVGFSAAIGEGAMADWSGVYLSDVVGVSAGTAALGFAAFSVFMTIGRLSGDRLAEMFSPMILVRMGGAIAAAGLLLASAIPETAPTLLGFGAVGLGLSVVVPLVFSAAGKLPGIASGTGIAGVATIGYAGFLAGPPIIGLIAEVTSLRFAMLLVALLAGSLIFTGRSLRTRRQ